MPHDAWQCLFLEADNQLWERGTGEVNKCGIFTVCLDFSLVYTYGYLCRNHIEINKYQMLLGLIFYI